jgi:hypothetical protein
MKRTTGIAAALVAAALAVFPAAAAAHGDHHRTQHHSSHGATSHGGAPGHSTPGHHHGHPGHPGHPSGPPSHPQPDPLSADSLLATVDQYGSAPDHYSGTPADWSELNVIAQQFGADGLQLGSIAYKFPRFEPTDVALSTDSHDVDSAALAPLLYSGTTGPSGIEAPLLAAANGTFSAADAAGKIVVVSQLSKGALAPSIIAAIAAGAEGLVYVTNGVGDLPRKEDVNSRKGTGHFPVLLVGKQSGATVVADAEAGESADLTLQAKLARPPTTTSGASSPAPTRRGGSSSARQPRASSPPPRSAAAAWRSCSGWRSTTRRSRSRSGRRRSSSSPRPGTKSASSASRR